MTGDKLAAFRLVGSFHRVALASLFASVAALWGVAAPADELSEATELQAQERWLECLPKAEAAAKSRAWNERAWHVLMQCQLRTGDHLGAAATFDEAFRRFPSSLRLRLLGREVLRMAGRPEQGQELVDQIDALVKQTPWRYTDAVNRTLLGRYYLGQGADARQVLEVFFDQAKRASPDLVDPHLATGELALDKGDFALAATSFQEALKRSPDLPAALLGLARAYDSSDSEKAAGFLERALELHPQHIPSLLHLADRQLDGELYEDAEATIGKVLEVNPEHPRAWASLAVISALRGEEQESELRRRVALAWWPQDPEVDHYIGSKLSRHYRFAEGAEHQRQVLKHSPDYFPAKLQLSQDLLRLGQEEKGWELAAEALDQDGYSVLAHNLVELRGELAKFRTLENDDFIVRMDAREAEVYGDRVLELLGEAREVLCEKYDHQLRTPVIVEIFPRQADFAIRTFGMPGGAGFLGVCFGSVITANSPASQGDSPTNWASVLWHEFCHVVTLQKTNNRMPRWLSEGISVYEERQRRPSWGQSMTPQYREMILGGELTPVSQLSNAFLRPPSPMHLQFAYYESSLVVEYLIEQYGLAPLLRVLDELGQGMPINDSLARTAGSIEALDRDFAEYARKRAEALAPGADWSRPEEAVAADPAQLQQWLDEHPDSLLALRRRAAEAMRAQRWEDAAPLVRRLTELLPRDSGSWEMLAQLHQATGDAEAEAAAWRELLEVDSDHQQACLRLIELAESRGQWDDVAWAGERLAEINPLQSLLQRTLAEAARQLDEPAAEVRARRAMIALGPADPALAHYRLAAAHRRLDQATEARRHVLLALAEAPRYRDAQLLLLQLVDERLEGAENAPAADEPLLPPLEQWEESPDDTASARSSAKPSVPASSNSSSPPSPHKQETP